MAFSSSKAEKLRKILVKDLNDAIICSLCNGYLIDATRLIDCFHVFCRGCILRHFENSKAACPTCNTIFKKKNQPCFRSDPPLQALVYKLIPGLFTKEMQRREDFYRSTGVRASSSCSDDSVLERERDLINDQETMIAEYIGDKTQFFGPEDYISLSLEYYQMHLDKTPFNNNGGDKKLSKRNQLNLTPVVVMDKTCDSQLFSCGSSSSNSSSSDKVSASSDNKQLKEDKDKCSGDSGSSNSSSGANIAVDIKRKDGDKRYLQCPAAVTMRHLQKFVRMKYALTSNHKVDIIYEGEVLPQHFSLMDVAYTFKWKRLKPLRFFYRIFTPLKIQPIKIINTALSTGEKQLQIVKPNESPKLLPPLPPPPPPPPRPDFKLEEKNKEEEKEILLANLQLQSKSKIQNNQVPEKSTAVVAAVPPTTSTSLQECVFDYGQPDKEEIKRFAEIRDREWALQKLDESREIREEEYHHSKKRKKNKHSKNDFTYKKRKLHAEITNKEEELKLKVKLTHNNGHKHKHHKSSSLELSSKEKLLQMRQVRHKHVSSEDKKIQTLPSGSVSKETSTDSIDHNDNPKPETAKEVRIPPNGITNSTKVPEEPPKPVRTEPPTMKNSSTQWAARVPTVQLERHELTEQAQKTFHIKSIQSYNEKFQKKVEKCPVINKEKIRPQSQLERKIANLQQRCTIETKPTPTPKPQEKKVVGEKPLMNPSCPPGFTVSKIESGIKRKLENEEQDKRPSLEITLINPPLQQSLAPPPQQQIEAKPVAKRPPPATIPLERIKKCKNLKTGGGLSIIPKMERCDNIGALDLSKTSKEQNNGINSTPTATTETKTVNGYNLPNNNKEVKSVNMSNLQMLSKVATEHLPTPPNNHKLNNNNNNNNNTNMTPQNKPRPQIPGLQTIKIPTPSNPKMPPNLHMLPKLTEINKTHFRMIPQIRNQNQNIRNIPNPSLLVRQQNQNRLNSINSMGNSSSGANTTKESETKEAPVTSSSSSEMAPSTTTIKISKMLDVTTAKEAVPV